MRYAFADCVLDTERCELSRAGELVSLRPKVLQVLTYLIEQHERVVSKQELFDKLWNGRIVGDATLNSCLKEARRAIGDSGAEQRIVKTLHGHGYHFIAPIREDHHGVAPAGGASPGEKPDMVLSDREYKQVSVLSCSIGEIDRHGIDAEGMDTLMRRFFAAVEDTLKRYGGTMSERMGDGFGALFGAPRAFEDHGRRAALAALELRRRALEMVESDQAKRLELDCGLHTGSAVVGSLADADQMYAAVGKTTQTARRLRDLSGGAILASEAFIGLIETEVHAEPVHLSGEETGYRILGMARLRAGVPQRRNNPATFVGREDEMAIIRKRMRLAEAGAGQTVCISGEPGIGKSRLIRELLGEFRDYPHLQANCLAYRVGSPYFPLKQLLRAACGIAADDGDELVAEKLRSRALAAGLEPALTETLLGLLDVGNAASDGRIADGQEAVLRPATQLLLHASDGGPRVVVIEDLHWLDPSSEEWLASFVARSVVSAQLLLLTHRPGYQSPWLSHSSVTQLALPRLSDADSAALIDSLKTPLANFEEIRRHIVNNAQGNPFFLEELTFNLVDQDGAPASEIPTTVQAVLSSRIDQLRPGDKSLLQMAAVIGTPVPQRLLAAVVDHGANDLEAALSRLEAGELLFEQHADHDRMYCFKHALTEDVAYQSLLIGARRACHRKIAETLEARFSRQAAAQPEILAHHFEQAALGEQAMAYWARAGTRAAQRSANPEAVLHFERALQVSESLPESTELQTRQLDIYLRLGPPLMSSKAFAAPSVEQAYLKAKRLCRSVGTKNQLFTVLWGLWLHYAHLGNIDNARELAQQILQLSDELSEPALQLQAHHAAWTNEIWHGDLESCKRHTLAGAELYEVNAHQTHRHLYGGHDPGVCAYGTAGVATWFLGYPDEARRLTQDGADLAARLAHPFSYLLTRNDFMELTALCGDPAATLEYAREGIDLCIELNVPIYLAMDRIYAGWSMAKMGQREEGLALLTRGIEEYGKTGAERRQPVHLLLLAEICTLAEHCVQGLEALDKAQELIDRTGEVRWAGEILRRRGELLLVQSPDSAAEASRLFEQARALAASQNCKAFELRAASSMASLLRRQGKRREGLNVLQPVYQWFSEGFATGDLRRAKQLLSDLAGTPP